MKKSMKINSLFVLLVVLFACNEGKKSENDKTLESVSTSIHETETETDTIPGSIPSEFQKEIGKAKFTINWYAPGVKDRIIWGGLVPFNKVWATGAHMATNIEFDRDLLIDGNRVKAGKYAIFTIPGKEEWTFILNSNWQQHLTDNYKVEEDILRIQVIAEDVENHQERLKYEVVERSKNRAEIVMSWEKKIIRIPLTIK